MNRQDRINAIMDVVLSKEYGDMIPHAELCDAAHERVDSNAYRDAVHAAMKRCVNAGKMIESVRGFGYRVVDPDEYTRQSVKCIVSGARKIDRGTKILLHAPVQDMTQDGREAYNRVTDRMRILQAAVHGAQVEIRMLSASREHPLAIPSSRT